MTVLTYSQKHFTAWKEYIEAGRAYRIRAEYRFDDDCRNGHNTFTITGTIDRRSGSLWCDDSGGCLHDEIRKHFPELAPYIKWHLVSTDGPMHYIANTVYHAEQGSLDYARSTAVWPDAGLDQLKDVDALKNRLPALLQDFQAAMESLGFTY